jgi:hypothetical protein
VSERLVRRVVLAALKGEAGSGGWVKIDAPKSTDKEISLAVMQAEERGLVKACEVTNFASHYPEWRLLGPTGASEQYIQETRVSKKVWATGVAIATAIVAFLGWLIPVVIDLLRK